MLAHLLIKNYALIKHLEISPSKDLNIITGETGAGKSIMLGAIGLLLGNRADAKALLDANEKCVIEGTFSIANYDLKSFFEEADIEYDGECLIRREISVNGKSRAFINDTPVNLDILKKWGSSLVDVHSQHETLLLGNANFQTSILDAFAGNKILVSDYKLLYKKYKAIQVEYNSCVENATEQKKQLDYHSFLYNELNEANLKEGEQEQIEESLKLLENAETIKSKLTSASQTLSGDSGNLVAQLQEVKKQLDHVSAFSTHYETLKNRVQSALIELKDVADELENENDKIEYNPAEIEKAQERLSLIYTLQKKHHIQTIDNLLTIQQVLKSKMDETLNLDEHIETLKKSLESTHKELLTQAKKLSETRKAVQLPIKNELEALLKEVGMPNATITVEVKETEITPTGMDTIAILFSANKGIPPQELKNAASGGEFSRLMLCIKYILADKTALPTIIFDEIDTGISGEVAIKVGKMMKQMAKNHQVISISHLPQIAAQGNSHYYVFKDNSSEKTISKMKLLTPAERVTEIAQMIGGEKPSETAVMSAKELLEL